MFEHEEPPKAKAKARAPASAAPSDAPPKDAPRFNLSILTVEELLRLHDDVIRHLPPTELSKMNLEKELLLQFHTVKALQGSIMENDEGIPMNQRAQVANTVSSSLKSLIDLQESVFSSERFKAVESVLIRLLSKLPERTASKFLTEYEEVIRRHA